MDEEESGWVRRESVQDLLVLTFRLEVSPRGGGVASAGGGASTGVHAHAALAIRY